MYVDEIYVRLAENQPQKQVQERLREYMLLFPTEVKWKRSRTLHSPCSRLFTYIYNFDQPLTAPATIPLMICLLNAKYRTTIGAMVSSIAAICFG